jgi:GH25 family lysozyme M1 (1,4-beta-N-acetylmuramidase)
MTSFIRSAVTAGATFVMAGALATGGVALASTADAATPPVTPTASSSGTAGTAAGGTASEKATATASPTATAGPTATASAKATATPTPSASAGTTDTSSSDPSLAAQNAAGNHAMGSTIPSSDPAALPATSGTLKFKSLAAQAAVTHTFPNGVKGLDVSAYQTGLNWKTLYSQGARFAYVKATEGTTYQSSQFASQYNGAYAAGMIRGAYVFATPNTSSGAAQASYFVAHGGRWSADGRTLPPLLDIEYGYNGTCWGLSTSAMVKWIADFSNTVLAQTGIRPAIYTTAGWWNQCTGSSKAFSANPFFVAQYPSSTTATSQPYSLGASWSKWTFWQWSSTGPFPGDSDVFNGTTAALTLLAKGSGATAIATPAADSGATLSAAKKLTSGQSVQSSNGQYTLGMQSDGNLVLRGNGRAIWQSATPNNAGGYAIMQADGNFVVYSKANKALWNTSTYNKGTGAKLVMQSNGDLQVVSTNGVVWHNGAPGTADILANTKLTGGQFLHDSSGLLQTMMQADGNFVVYIGGKAKFNTRTNGYKGATLTLQTDGNLVLRDAKGTVRWLTKTSTAGAGAYLTMQTDGNLVLRNKAGAAIWNSKTHV